MTRTTFLSAVVIGLLALTGCANRRSQQTAQAQAPTYAPPPGSQVYYQRPYQEGDAPPADLAWGDVYVDNQSYAQPVDSYPVETIGYETMSSGEQVVVVTYVHTYVDPIETYPRVYWAGRWYYNVSGSFVFWDPFWGSWVYYWGPPAPLVVAWNYHYPWVGYSWGYGYYGGGWYWGGCSQNGWHAYGRPPSGWRPSHGPNADQGGPTGGRPSHDPNGGGGGGGGGPTTGVGAGGGSGDIEAPNTTGGAIAGGRDKAAVPNKPARAGGTPTVNAARTDVAAPKPGRAPLDAKPQLGSKAPVASSNPARRIEPSQPPRAPVAANPTAARAELATPPRQQPARARVPSLVQVHDASGGTTRPTYAPPTARRAPTTTVTNRAPSTSTSLGTNPNPRAPARSSSPTYESSSPTRASSPSASSPTYRTVTPSSPSRSSGSSSPSRSSGGGSSYTPSRSSGGGSSYTPSRSSSPSRSSGGSSYTPSRSSSPSRSSGSSSSPSRSSGGGGGGGGSRSSSPSRSSGGGRR